MQGHPHPVPLAPEDQGGAATLREIERRFGGQVARIVAGCTDTTRQPKPPWRERKERYIRHLQRAPRSVLLVKAADTLHNVRSILTDHRRHGERLWSRFKGGRVGTAWYVSAIASTLQERLPASRSVQELSGLVNELARRVQT
jgi:GTP pyrophosphokinase